MEKQVLQLSIEISASKEKIWDVLLNDETYRIWTSAFYEGSYAESDWKEGSKVYFKSPEGDGMVSTVKVHQPGKIISFEHNGVLRNGKEVYDDPEMEKWKGLNETYRLEAINENRYRLKIEQDITSDYAASFEKMWEQALQKVKELSEQQKK